MTAHREEFTARGSLKPGRRLVCARLTINDGPTDSWNKADSDIVDAGDGEPRLT